ncbi:OmpA family protein [Photobacterium angustum]|uniref:OmpA family protein n=1 Tax=Photobacterium angustum TaxID=661 RepID=A0A855SGS5_PHOAN|nr:OmpA family protein [Photobacterium angustum]KJF83060.1 membrane protein [Photobacterium damselae subsp. damselae]KJG43106.1 membrane protein [Photobacterium angustum]KJG47370.1 membrane protein [Photobacterium angustum]KJG49399.1 membrane protein [Photobacterium angustum]KJG53530.1 membrane protein [Photobacterium angustum]
MSKARFAILPLALLISGAVNAATVNPFYAGVRAGGVHYSDFDSKNYANGTYDQELQNRNAIDRDDFAAGLFMGYNVTPWFAIEGGYTWLGEATLKGDKYHNLGKVEQQAIDLVGKFTYQATDKVDLYTKVGGAWQFTRAKVEGVGSDRDDSLIATAGLGAEYHFTDNLSARAEYQYYHNMETKPTGTDTKFNWDANYYGVSLVYGWGAPAPVVAPVVEEVVEATTVQVEPVTVSIPFAFDSYKITHADKERLAPIAKRLQDNPETELVVVGHTDSKGAEAYNQKLSEERAQKVATFLMNEYNLDSSRVRAEGRGELDPVASNKTEAGRTDNRRVDVTASGYEMVQEAGSTVTVEQ